MRWQFVSKFSPGALLNLFVRAWLLSSAIAVIQNRFLFFREMLNRRANPWRYEWPGGWACHFHICVIFMDRSVSKIGMRAKYSRAIEFRRSSHHRALQNRR